jgi:hypothetical protein
MPRVRYSVGIGARTFLCATVVFRPDLRHGNLRSIPGGKPDRLCPKCGSLPPCRLHTFAKSAEVKGQHYSSLYSSDHMKPAMHTGHFRNSWKFSYNKFTFRQKKKNRSFLPNMSQCAAKLYFLSLYIYIYIYNSIS